MGSQAHTELDLRFREYSHYTEIRQLAYNIASRQHEKMFQSLAVLSYFHGEGRTLLCVALALAYAEACRSKVLIVDTTQRGGAGSLALNECLPNPESGVTVIPLAQRLRNSSTLAIQPPEPVEDEKGLDIPFPDSYAAGSDFSMIMKVTKENPEQYGLILLDTMPLSSRNKNNIDPRLVARVANGSVLVVSKKFLDAPKLDEQLKMLEDPSLHLIGMISNEEFTR